MIGIVFVSYRIPEKRLREHFEWNLSEYQKRECRVYVVTDREYQFPRVARCLVYPEPMEIFSLAKTKNHGIRAAIADGCDPIIVTDVDVCFSQETFSVCEHVDAKTAVVPICLMAQDYDTCERDYVVDGGMGCCIAAHADVWRKVAYDERYVGYGCDDGQIRMAIKRLGIREDRSHVVFHIAHDPEASQVNIPGFGRPDCWNRENGFNPENARHNAEIYHSR